MTDKLPNGLFQTNFCGSLQANPQGYLEQSSFGRRMHRSTATHALQLLETARAKEVQGHEANLPILARNKEYRDQIVALMKEAGVPDSFTERDHKSRSRYIKTVRVDAGYLGDLRRFLPITDGFESSHYPVMKQRYDEYAVQAEKLEADEQMKRLREAEAAAERRKADLALAGMILRYQLPEDSTWGSALGALRSKDQRLDLAVAMQQTRGDWSDGAYRVSDALGRFTIHTDEDKAIATDTVSHLREFEDGRVFRDCEWNYGRLFASAADQQLAADIQTALSHIEP